MNFDDYDAFTAANCRLIILKALAKQNDARLNETMIGHELRAFAHTKSRDYIRTQLRRLEELSAVKLYEVGSVFVAELRQPGLDHVERHAFLEGVGRPSLEQ